MKTTDLSLLFDLDGVVYLGDQGVPGAGEALAEAEQRGHQVLFCTNNSSRTRAAATQKIHRTTGYQALEDQVITSAMAAAHLLADDPLPCYVLGGPGIGEALEGIGAEVVDDWREAKAVVIGFSPHLTYELLRSACQAVWNGAKLIATNTDPNFPTNQGLWPAAGAIVAAVEYATGQTALPAGKPHLPMIQIAKKKISSPQVIMVGDRIETDLQMAVSAGWYAVLALSGVTRKPPVSPQPDAVIKSIADLGGLLDKLTPQGLDSG